MKTEAVHLAFMLVILAVCGAAEELLPGFCGTSFPLLLAATLAVAMRAGLLFSLSFAAAAGAVEDALCGLPGLACVSFFAAAAFAARMKGFKTAAAVLSYPLLVLWAAAWTHPAGTPLLTRFAAAFPAGLAADAVMFPLVAFLAGKAAIGD